MLQGALLASSLGVVASVTVLAVRPFLKRRRVRSRYLARLHDVQTVHKLMNCNGMEVRIPDYEACRNDVSSSCLRSCSPGLIATQTSLVKLFNPCILLPVNIATRDVAGPYSSNRMCDSEATCP